MWVPIKVPLFRETIKLHAAARDGLEELKASTAAEIVPYAFGSTVKKSITSCPKGVMRCQPRSQKQTRIPSMSPTKNKTSWTLPPYTLHNPIIVDSIFFSIIPI